MHNDAPRQFPAGWYPDEYCVGMQRYWDGTQWTQHTQNQPPPPPPPVLPPIPVGQYSAQTGQHPAGPAAVPPFIDGVASLRAAKLKRANVQIVVASVSLVVILGFMTTITSNIAR